MSTLPPPATGAPPPAQPAASRVVSTREAFDILGKWADAHPQDSNHETVVSELEKLGDKSVWDDPSRANEVAGRLNTLLTLINSNVRTAAAVLTPATPPAQTTTPSAQPAPNPPAWTPPANPPARTTTPPAQPAPRSPWLTTWTAWTAWRRLVVVSAVIAIVLVAAAAGAAAGLAAIAAAATGASIGISGAIAAAAIRRGGGGAIAAAAGLAAIAAATAGLVASGHVSLSGGTIAALLAGAGLAALLAGGQEIVAAMQIAADKDGSQRPQR